MRNIFESPEVRVLSSYDSRVEGWKISRPYLKEDPTLESLTSMDLMVNSLCGYVFYVKSSIFMRDLLFTLRPAPAWARSNRTIEFTEDNLKVSSEYRGYDDEFLLKTLDDVLSDLKNGIPQDFAKKKLPMAFSTEYTISLDDRTLVAFLKMLKLHCPDLYNIYGKLFLDSIGRDDNYVENRNCKDIYKSYAVSDYEKEHVNEVHECMEMFIGSYRMSNNLMAQFIRTSNNKYHNGLYNKIDGKGIGDIVYEMCNDETNVVVYADKESFKKVISTRSCWFAQFDKEDNSSWSSVIGPYVRDMKPSEFLGILPCKGNCNRCGIEKDMKPRMEGVEVNPVCPILVQKPSIVKARGKKYGSDSTVYNKWVELVEFNMIHNNVDNEKRKVYEGMLETKSDTSEWGPFKNLD